MLCVAAVVLIKLTLSLPATAEQLAGVSHPLARYTGTNTVAPSATLNAVVMVPVDAPLVVDGTLNLTIVASNNFNPEDTPKSPFTCATVVFFATFPVAVKKKSVSAGAVLLVNALIFSSPQGEEG